MRSSSAFSGGGACAVSALAATHTAATPVRVRATIPVAFSRERFMRRILARGVRERHRVAVGSRQWQGVAVPGRSAGGRARRREVRNLRRRNSTVSWRSSRRRSRRRPRTRSRGCASDGRARSSSSTTTTTRWRSASRSSERTSDAVFSIAVFPRWVSLFFLQTGAQLTDPKGLLKGSRQPDTPHHADRAGRHRQPGRPGADERGAGLAEVKVRRAAAKGRIVIKSVSAKQRPRRPRET